MYSSISEKLYETKIDLDKIKSLVANFYNIPKEVLNKVKVYFENLPYVLKIEKIGNRIKIYINKILGFYIPGKKEIYIDEKIPYKCKVLTLLHEYVHAAQDYIGKFYRKSREFIETEARKVSEYLLRKYFKY
jgi:Zn-dependent peptidase ImmA (M78 family)